MIPASRKRRITLSSRLSSTRFASRAISTSWFTRSKEFLQIHIHHPSTARLDVPLRLTHCIMRPAPRPESVAVLAERGIEDRLQHLQNGLLDDPVEHGR